jgi:DNA-binding beta-propeller fold protein YncE
MKLTCINSVISVLIFLSAMSALAEAQVVGVALDTKAEMVDGEVKIPVSRPPDSVVFFAFSGAKRQELGRVTAPTSFQGPPSAVAISADRTLALVSASLRISLKDPKEFMPDNKLTVISLNAKRINVVQTIELAFSPSSIAMNAAGTLALAMHPADDSVSVLAIADHKVKVVEILPMGKGSSPMAAAFNPDGKTVLITLPGDGVIGLFNVEGGRLKMPAIRKMSAGIRPTALSYCGNTGLAVVSNYGKVTGDFDTVSLIDVAGTASRVIDTVSVGPAPEGIACSLDGRYAAAAIQNMSTVSKSDPFYAPNSMVVLLRIDGKHFKRVADAPIGGWAQGVGFLDDSRTLFAQSMMDRSMHFFRIEKDSLEASKPIVFQDGAPVSYGISGR